MADRGERVAEVVERRSEVKNRTGVPAALRCGGEILEAGFVAGIDPSHADGVERVHRQAVLACLVGESEGFAREIGSLGIGGMGNDDVSCVPGDRSRCRDGHGSRAGELDRPPTGLLGPCHITSVVVLAPEDLRRLCGATGISLREESVRRLGE